MGCFWGAERKFWQTEGVYTTAVGYAGGFTPNPRTKRCAAGAPATPRSCSSCSTRRRSPYDEMLRVFWENHDPTQGMRQGNDIGTQYRSAIYCYGAEQLEAAEESRVMFQAQLTKAGYGEITTEIVEAPTFYYAEDYHQQYLAKNPGGLLRHRRHRRELPDRAGARRLSRRTLDR